jgi:predicted peptidase
MKTKTEKAGPLFLAAALLTQAGCTSLRTTTVASSPLSQQMPKHFKVKRTLRLTANYLLFLPEGYEAKSEKRWPLILFLHGAGERGNDIWKVATHGPPKNVKQHPEFPFIVVSPQCPEGEIWSNDLLLALLDQITRTHAVDTNRVYLTGLSMGGYGTWNLGLTHPEKFAAIVPICGGGELITILLPHDEKALKSLGVWAFHGAKDPTVPLDESQRMVDQLKKKGLTDVKLTIYPEAGHDSWIQAYNDPELYRWLLAHERKPESQ